MRAPPSRRPGYVLLVVLLVVVVLSLAGYRFAEAMASEYQAAAGSTESAQSKAFAVSGVYYTAGVMADPTAVQNILGGNPYDSQAFAGVPVGGDKPRGGGRFALINLADNGSAAGSSRFTPRYGVSDESGKVNINALLRLDQSGEVLRGILIELPGMTEELADSISDWVDTDDDQRASGAESGSYTGYVCKNGPLSSIDELLYVRGMTPDILYGTDRNRNGRADPDEPQDVDFSRGLSDYLTVYGHELNIDSTGAPRVHVNETDLKTLNTTLAGVIGQDLADYAVAYRLYTTQAAGTVATGSRPRRTGGVADLRTAVSSSLSGTASARRTIKNSMTALYNTQVVLPRPANARDEDPDVVVPCPLNDRDYFNKILPTLLDKTTAKSAYELNPRLNVNTASPEVLKAVSGVTQEEIDSAIAIRDGLTPGTPEYLTGAWLVTQAGMRPEIFATAERLITGYTQTYRVQSLGYFARGGPVARVEAVIDTNQGYPRIVYFRDLTDLGPGFSPPR
jgi:Type II secretion system (T2SS), protein K